MSGCHREPNASAGVTELEKAFPDGNANSPIYLALAAARTNDLGLGVIALNNAKQVPGLSAEQLATVEKTAQVFTSELVRRASSGDAKAKADLEFIERSRSQ